MQALLASIPKKYEVLLGPLKELKGNAKVCATTVGLSQALLLADRSDMDHIIEAVRKIQAHSAALAKKA